MKISHTINMKRKGKAIKIITIAFSLFFLTAILSFFLLLEPNVKIKGWQSLDTSRLSHTERTITILDNEDIIVANNIYASNKKFTNINDIPMHVIDAFLSIEDKRFYKHKGVDYTRIIGAIKNNIFSKSYQEGASTITQQLIKNTHLSNEKTIIRKIKEIRIARELERLYSKKEILEMYLNILYFGNNMYGIGTASNLLFNKEPKNLTLSEGALLAGIINNPSLYNPIKKQDNVKKRRNLVLKQMYNLNKINADEYQTAILSDVIVNDQFQNSLLPYFNSILKEASEILKINEENIFKQKLIIGTQLNNRIQMQLSNVMRDIILDNGVIARALVMNNKDASIVSEYCSSSMNLSASTRQPGSTIKPILCYTPAYEKKLIMPCSHILDEKMKFGAYSPSNYKNKYYGYVTAKESLKLSLNIPAIKLVEMSDLSYCKSIAESAGLTFDAKDNSLALALGGFHKGVTLAQLINSYQPFSNKGNYNKYNFIRYIKDSQGNVLYVNNKQAKQIISEDSAFFITDALQECAQKGTAKKLHFLSNIAAKTGTVGNTNNNSDAYCIAYSPSHTVCVWIGTKNNHHKMKITGGGYPTLLAGSIIHNLNLNQESFAVPNTIIRLPIDTKELNKNHRVQLAGADIPLRQQQKEYFSINNIPKQYSYNTLPDFFQKQFTDIDTEKFEILN